MNNVNYRLVVIRMCCQALRFNSVVLGLDFQISLLTLRVGQAFCHLQCEGVGFNCNNHKIKRRLNENFLIDRNQVTTTRKGYVSCKYKHLQEKSLY